MTGDKSIVEYIEERLDKGGIELPIFDGVALKLQEVLKNEDYRTEELAEIVEKDQSLTSKILKMANSSFYSGLNPTTTIHGAIVRLGAKSLVNMAMFVTQQQSYNKVNKRFIKWMDPLWVHALGVALASKWLAQHLGLRKLEEESFLAGLLHDIGKLLLVKIIEDLQDSDEMEQDISDSVINDVFETLHCNQGNRLMKHLNMPPSYCDVVLRHDDEELTDSTILINIVRLANMTCHKLGIGLKKDSGLMLSATGEAISLMASDLLLAELQVELEVQLGMYINMLK